MKKYFTTSIGRLRMLGFLEGTSLLLLVMIGVPMKYFFDNPSVVKSIGPIHGVLFLLFVLIAIVVSFQQKWSFFTTTWKVLLSCLIPFGTFYVDHTILKNIQNKEN
jgi:integral membrane protein